MKKIIVLLIAIVAVSSALLAYEPHFMDDPAISPDGDTVCFAYMGDLWLVPFEGGVAKRITKSEPAESNPVFSPNGKMIAFNSNRDGSRRIYVMPAEGGEARMVRDESLSLDSWFHDNKHLLVSKSWPYEKPTVNLKLSLDGETITEVNPYTDSYSCLSPDDNKIIYNNHGLPYRESYTGSLNGDLWEYDLRLKKYTRLTNTETTERYPVYSSKDDKIYFAASDGKIFQLYCVEKRDFGSPKKLTDFKEWSVRDIDIAVKNDRIVFELFDELWRYDPKAGLNKSAKIEIDIQEDTWYELDKYEDVMNRFSNIAVSGDEKLLAFSYKYDLFAMPVKGGEVKQLTHDQRGIHDLYILPDNRTIIFSAYEAGVNKLYKVNILEPDKIEKINWSSDKHIDNVSSAPGKQYIIDYSEGVEKINRIALMDSTATQFRIVKKDNTPWNGFEISENGKYALYITRDNGVWNSHIHFYEFETEWDKVIYSSDEWTSGLSWGKDNNSIFFTNNKKLCRMDLSPISDFKFQKDHWLEISADSLKTEEKKAEDIAVDWTHLSERVTPIVQKSEWANVFTVRNDSILYYWQDKKLFKVNYQGKNEKLIYTFNHDWSSWEYIFDKNIVYFVGGNLLYKVDLNSGSSSEIKNSFKYSYNKLELNRNVFKQVWGDFGRGFYDPYMHNVDWNKAFEKYYPYTKYMYESGLLSDIVEEMIGEVNASHTGFYPRSERSTHWHQGAFLGAVLDWSTNLKRGIPLTKVYLYTQLSEFYKIKEGAVLLSINGIEVNKDTALDPILRNKAGERLKLEIEQDGKVIEAEIKALSWREQYQAAYGTWEETRKERVRTADPDLGYIHLRAMGYGDLNQFNDDLFSTEFAKKGLILDLRGNSGGRVHDKIIEVLTKQAYAWENSRGSGASEYMSPARIFDKPMVMLIDEGSFSDGEIFPHVFKFLKLGKVIGVPTSGSVIGTVPHDLMDGSSMRMPRNGWWLDDENRTNMEGNGVQPDIIVELTPEDIVNDNDTQLQKAIEVLREEIKTGK